VEDTTKYFDRFTGAIKFEEFLDWMEICKVYKKVSAAWRSMNSYWVMVLKKKT
jgi:hypothetical protein